MPALAVRLRARGSSASCRQMLRHQLHRVAEIDRNLSAARAASAGASASRKVTRAMMTATGWMSMPATVLRRLGGAHVARHAAFLGLAEEGAHRVEEKRPRAAGGIEHPLFERRSTACLTIFAASQSGV